MKRLCGKKIGSILLAVLLFCTEGCGMQVDLKSNIEEETGEKDAEILSWITDKPVVFAYEIPQARPYILVDESGYLPTQKKVAVLLGEDLSEKFQVLSMNTQEIVYTGSLKQTQEAVYTADFTELEEEGTYCIVHKELGESYPFVLSEDLYEQQFEEYMEQIAQMDFSGDLHTSLEVLSALLLSYELYPESFIQEKETKGNKAKIPEVLQICKEGIDKILTFQNHTTGGVSKEVITSLDKDKDKEVDLYDTAFFAAVVAKFCNSYKEFDAQCATEDLKYALLSMQYVQKSREKTDARILYYMEAEIYRVTERSSDRKELEDILKEEAFTFTDTFDAVFLGNITYLTTALKVDADICSSLMEEMTFYATTITNQAKSMEKLSDEDQTKVLSEACLIAFASRVNKNYEYSWVLENLNHFFQGQNTSLQKVYDPEQAEISYTELSQMLLCLSALR